MCVVVKQDGCMQCYLKYNSLKVGEYESKYKRNARLYHVYFCCKSEKHVSLDSVGILLYTIVYCKATA